MKNEELWDKDGGSGVFIFSTALVVSFEILRSVSDKAAMIHIKILSFPNARF
jgi:hypothetical protein